MAVLEARLAVRSWVLAEWRVSGKFAVLTDPLISPPSETVAGNDFKPWRECVPSRRELYTRWQADVMKVSRAEEAAVFFYVTLRLPCCGRVGGLHVGPPARPRTS